MKMKEMNCHKLLSTMLSLVVSVGLSAQMSVGVGQWKTHLSYNTTKCFCIIFYYPLLFQKSEFRLIA